MREESDPPTPGERGEDGPGRTRLAARQRELVQALLSGDVVPAGFDAHRIAVEARSLLVKRRSVATKLRPDLVDRLGSQFALRFDEWALDHPKPADSSFRADLNRFETWLYARGHLARPRRRRRRLRGRRG